MPLRFRCGKLRRSVVSVLLYVMVCFPQVQKTAKYLFGKADVNGDMNIDAQEAKPLVDQLWVALDDIFFRVQVFQNNFVRGCFYFKEIDCVELSMHFALNEQVRMYRVGFSICGGLWQSVEGNGWR